MRARARCSSTSAVTSGPSSCTCPPRTRAPRSPTGARARRRLLPTTTTHYHAHDHAHAHPHVPHVAVVGRPAGDRLAYTAVFPELVAGRYVLTLPDESELPVDVAGGAVTELRWPRS